MLATKGTHVPTDSGWTHEVKWDGVRVLAETTKGGTTRLLSRNDNVVTVAWPELNRSPLGDRDLLVDGEVIALNDRGLPDFRVLQDRMHVRNAATAAKLAQQLPATYMVFDVMRLDGRDLTVDAARGAPHGSWATSGWSTPRGRCRTRTTTARCSTTPPSSRASRGSSASD